MHKTKEEAQREEPMRVVKETGPVVRGKLWDADQQAEVTGTLGSIG